MKIHFLILSLSAVTAAALLAGTPVEEIPAKGGYDGKTVIETDPLTTEWGGPILGSGLMSNDEFTEGALFLVYPFINTIGEGGTMEGTMFFIEPYGTWAEAGELGGSLGFGFRHLFSNQSVQEATSGTATGLFDEGIFIGANFFVDYAESVHGNSFWQTGAGVELGSRHIEFRSNYYHPHTDDQTISRSTETSVHRSSTSSTRTILGPPTAGPGGSVVQSATRQTTTRTTTTTRQRNFEIFEEALEGWDIEMAVLLPYIDEYCDVKLVGGYYSYEGDRSQRSDFDGWRAGIEVRPIPAVVMHATWFESDRLYKDNWLAGIRVELPLDDMRGAFTPRRRHLAERLFEPVHRKNTAVSSSGAVSEETNSTSNTSTSTNTQQTTTTNTVTPPPPMMMEKKEKCDIYDFKWINDGMNSNGMYKTIMPVYENECLTKPIFILTDPNSIIN